MVSRLTVKMSASLSAHAREGDQLSVRREVRRFRRVDRRQVDAHLDLLRDHVLHDQRTVFFRAHEIGEAIALRRPGHPRHRVPASARRRQVLEAHALIEAARQVADDRAVLRRDQDDVVLAVAAVAGHAGDQIARGRRFDRQHVGELALARIGRQVAAVVGRPLLVAERLEALLQVAIELLVPFLGRDLERFLVGVVAAADHRTTQREDVGAHAFLAPFRFHELERGVTEVVDEARIAEAAVVLHLAHLRHDVGDGGVAHGHDVERAPVAGHVVRHAFEHPQRHVAADQPGRDDVELELVRELMDDQAIEQIGRLVDRHDDAIAAGLGERADAFLRRAGLHVLLPELARRREQDQRQLHRQIVFELGADVLIRALGIARDAFEMRLDLRVVIDLEVFGLVGVPLEVVVADLVLAEVGDVAGLRQRKAGRASQRQQ